MESWAERFDLLKQWVQDAASMPGAAGTDDEPGIGILSSAELVTLAACIDDLRGYLLEASTGIAGLFGESPDVENLDTCLINVGVQLDLADRNFRELSELLVMKGIWPEDLFDDLGDSVQRDNGE